MAPTIAQTAEAFSTHRFAETYDHLDPDVRWESVGGSTLLGRAAVVAACEESLGYLATTTTEFQRLRTVAGTDMVAVDTLATYVDTDGATSTVASCDIYVFAGTTLTEITSYAVELTAGVAGG